ncbi:glycoside hydrolase family 16 protein, partial [Saccharata proteae CBS 121410]
SQLTSTCNPTKKSCPADTALDTDTSNTDFTSGASSQWTTTAGTINYGSNGAEFTINESGDSPTIATNFYIFFGSITVTMRAAPGVGIVSSIVLESDDLDEVDWEFLGGAIDEVESNYFGKGNTTSYDRAVYHTVSDVQNTQHTYRVDWTAAAITWSIDSQTVRTLEYGDAVSGTNFPQTPMRVRLGIWAGGDSKNDAGTIGWAGGTTDFGDAPFTMYVQSVDIVNYSPGSGYKWTDETGDWTSIEVEGGSTGSNAGGGGSGGTGTTGTTGTTTSANSDMWWTAAASA